MTKVKVINVPLDAVLATEEINKEIEALGDVTDVVVSDMQGERVLIQYEES